MISSKESLDRQLIGLEGWWSFVEIALLRGQTVCLVWE